MADQPLDRAALVQALNARAQKPHAALTLVGSFPFGDREIARYRMQNGLGLLLLRDDAAKVVSYHTWFGVGSRHEQPGKTGLAHLFEHLMFNETVNLPAGEFDRTLEAAGGEVNAATWVDWTFYYENVPSSELSLVMRLEAERMQNLVLREPQVASEKEVVANERRYRVDDDVEGAVNEVLYKTAFTRHPYHWPTIGWMEDIAGFTTEDCERFYAAYYAPNNASVVLVGDFDEQAALAGLQDQYGGIAQASIPAHSFEAEPAQREERVLSLSKPTPTEKLLLGYKSPGLGEPEYAVLTVLNEVLTGGRSSRLYRALITTGELASDVRGSASPTRDPGLYELWVSLREGQRAEAALQVVEQVLADIAREGIAESELEKAKNRLELGFLHGMETAGGKAEQIGFYETVLGDAARIFEQLEAYREVRREQVALYVRERLVREQRTTLLVRPAQDDAGGDDRDQEAA